MFWLALLVLGAIGLAGPGKALARKFSNSSDDSLKILLAAGAFLLFIFGIEGIAAGLKANFFLMLLPALGVWLGILAVIEMGRRRIGESDSNDVSDSIKVDAFWQHPDPKGDRPGHLFSDDPWDIFTGQSKVAQILGGAAQSAGGQDALIPKPVIEKHHPVERDDSGLIVSVPEMLAMAPSTPDPPPVPTPPDPGARSAPEDDEDAREGLVEVLERHIKQGQAPEPAEQTEQETDQEEAEKPGTELDKVLDRKSEDGVESKLPPAGPIDMSQMKAEPESAVEGKSPAQTPAPQAQTTDSPVTEAAAETADAAGKDSQEWLKKEKPIKDIDPAITEQKEELEATPLEESSGKFTYKPQLVKSLFGSGKKEEKKD